MSSNRHVVPRPNGGWDIKKPGSSRSSGHEARQSDAIKCAKGIVRNHGLGDVRVHGRGGKTRDSDIVASGNDSFPPRDRKH